MIEQAHHEYQELSIERLCELCSVSRSWYYERTSRPESTEEETALRDQIERIIREFPGYGYRRLRVPWRERAWQSITSGYCALCARSRCCVT